MIPKTFEVAKNARMKPSSATASQDERRSSADGNRRWLAKEANFRTWQSFWHHPRAVSPRGTGRHSTNHLLRVVLVGMSNEPVKRFPGQVSLIAGPADAGRPW